MGNGIEILPWVQQNNRQKDCEEYWVNGVRHRDPSEGPAITRWYDCGQKYYEEYLENGRYHRDPSEGPAYTVWRTNGQKSFEKCWVNGS